MSYAPEARSPAHSKNSEPGNRLLHERVLLITSSFGKLSSHVPFFFKLSCSGSSGAAHGFPLNDWT
jgi:hypothetical protein